MNETLNPERKLDALKFFSQTHRSLHDQRRKSETQAFFTTLTFFALLGATRFTGKAALPTPLPASLLIGLWTLITVTAVVSALYLHGIHGANQVNKEFAQRAEDQIQRILKDNGARRLADCHDCCIRCCCRFCLDPSVSQKKGEPTNARYDVPPPVICVVTPLLIAVVS